MAFTPKLVAAYIPDRFQDYYIPVTDTVQQHFAKMGSQILNEAQLDENPPGSEFNHRPRNVSCLQVHNIPEHRDIEEIRASLKNCGTINSCTQGPVQNDGTYVAYLTFEKKEEAQKAYEAIDGRNIEEGYTLRAGLSLTDSRHGRSRVSRRTSPYASGHPHRRFDFPLRISVSGDMVGAIIGRGGATIRQITQQTKARVDILRKDGYGDTEKVITIFGTQEGCSSACEKILQVMQTESTAKGQGEIPLKVLAHNNLIGRLIGKGGANIKRIMEQTNAKITVSGFYEMNRQYVERVIAVRGTLEDICKAEKLISKKLRQCFESDLAAAALPNPYVFPGMNSPVMVNEGLQMTNWMHPGSVPRGILQPSNQFMYANPPFPYPQYPPLNQYVDPPETTEEACLFIQNSSVGAIIGTSGSTIREMIHRSGALIRVDPTQPSEKVDKSSLRRVTITGTPEAQWKAQYQIYKKLAFESCSDVKLKVEFLVPSSQVGRIIGKGGRRIKEFQQDTNTQIRVPDGYQKTEASTTPIQITGDFYGSQAAQRQIRALIRSPMPYDARNRSPAQSTST